MSAMKTPEPYRTHKTHGTDTQSPSPKSRLSPETGFIPPHGGYEDLLSFQKARIVYDATVRFCDRFVDRRSRTHDQMVQAARSGKQNILEGSRASGTSKETELKLTNVARASLEELLESKRAFRRDLAARPIGEKLRMLDALRERELAFFGQARQSAAGALREDLNTTLTKRNARHQI